MNPIPSREEALFADAVARPAAERAAFLATACGEDAALRARVDALLVAHETAADLLDSPAVNFMPLPEEKAGDWIGRYKLLQKIG